MREGLAKGAKFSVVELKELPYVDITSQMYSIDNFNFQMKLLYMSLVVVAPRAKSFTRARFVYHSCSREGS